MFLGINIFWALLRAHFNPRLTARAKMSLSRAQNIFMLAKINSIVSLYISTTEIQGLNFDNFDTQCPRSLISSHSFVLLKLHLLNYGHAIASLSLGLRFLWSDVCNHQRVCRTFQALERL